MAGDVDLTTLHRALQNVSDAPQRAPWVSDFGIDADDVDQFLRRTSRCLLDEEGSDWDFCTVIEDDLDSLTASEITRHAPGLRARVASLLPSELRLLLMEGSHAALTQASYATIWLYNSVGDSLSLSYSVTRNATPYYLPWTIRYGDAEILTFDVALAKLLIALLSDSKWRSRQNHKDNLLRRVFMLGLAEAEAEAEAEARRRRATVAETDN